MQSVQLVMKPKSLQTYIGVLMCAYNREESVKAEKDLQQTHIHTECAPQIDEYMIKHGKVSTPIASLCFFQALQIWLGVGTW